ncbi:MAG: GCN5-related N-acetyltransferase [Gemmatimonadetes bacterium]|nr:GCN5-related N-acetyltransferase [Gemmatimonadota bacterium]
MSFAARHRDDPMPVLPELRSLSTERVNDVAQMSLLQGRGADEIARRFDAGHRAYVALLNDAPAAWGWVATRTASIGELGTTFTLPEGDRYLWNFVTLPSHRGLGVYPRLLQAIVRSESDEAERFWIAYAPENHASGSGITKAGFVALADMSFDRVGRPSLRALQPGGAMLASQVLGLPETTEALTPCWRCVRAGRIGMTCAAETCQCDYQRPQSECAPTSRPEPR